jgi:hypothetical protein
MLSLSALRAHAVLARDATTPKRSDWDRYKTGKGAAIDMRQRNTRNVNSLYRLVPAVTSFISNILETPPCSNENIRVALLYRSAQKALRYTLC